MREKERKGNGIKMPFTIYFIPSEMPPKLGKYTHGLILVILAMNHPKI
jgi:hypothetical protein